MNHYKKGMMFFLHEEQLLVWLGRKRQLRCILTGFDSLLLPLRSPSLRFKIALAVVIPPVAGTQAATGGKTSG